jgi:hypothetical protein
MFQLLKSTPRKHNVTLKDSTLKELKVLIHNDNGTYIYRLRNNLFIHTTSFDPNGSSSGAFSCTSHAIRLQHNIHT